MHPQGNGGATHPNGFSSQLRVEAAGGWPRRSHLLTLRAGGDSAFYLCREFKSLFPPRVVGSLVPILGGCPVTGQMRILPPLPLCTWFSPHPTVTRGQQETSWTEPSYTGAGSSGKYPAPAQCSKQLSSQHGHWEDHNSGVGCCPGSTTF